MMNDHIFTTSDHHIARCTPDILLWSAKSLQTIRLNRHRCTTPLGRDVSAQRPRIRVIDESLGWAAISASAISRNSIGRISFFRKEFTRSLSTPCVSTHFRLRTSFIICQLAYFVRTCWNYTNTHWLFSFSCELRKNYPISGQVLRSPHGRYETRKFG